MSSYWKGTSTGSYPYLLPKERLLLFVIHLWGYHKESRSLKLFWTSAFVFVLEKYEMFLIKQNSHNGEKASLCLIAQPWLFRSFPCMPMIKISNHYGVFYALIRVEKVDLIPNMIPHY